MDQENISKSEIKTFSFEVKASGALVIQEIVLSNWQLMISADDLAYLISLGDTNTGYIMRDEFAKERDMSVKIIDALVLWRIYGEDSNEQ